MKMQKFEIRVLPEDVTFEMRMWPPVVDKGSDTRETWAVITGPNGKKVHVHNYAEVIPTIRKMVEEEKACASTTS